MYGVYVVFIDWDSSHVNPTSLLELMSVLPEDIQVRLKRFYHKEDSWRSLVGHLLPRHWLTEIGISINQVTFEKSKHGKPLITRSPVPLSYNVTHDSDIVAIACQRGEPVGIDAMKVALPRNTTLDQFIDLLSEQLTDREKQTLQPSSSDEATNLVRLYRMWTVKEAYTKAIGEGVGYDFARVEYDVIEKVVRVDGQVPRGWDITSFLLTYKSDQYVISVACQVGGDESRISHLDAPPNGLLRIVDIETLAREFAPSGK